MNNKFNVTNIPNLKNYTYILLIKMYKEQAFVGWADLQAYLFGHS